DPRGGPGPVLAPARAEPGVRRPRPAPHADRQDPRDPGQAAAAGGRPGDGREPRQPGQPGGAGRLPAGPAPDPGRPGPDGGGGMTGVPQQAPASALLPALKGPWSSGDPDDTFDIHDPATGSVLATVHGGGAAEVDAAVA